MYIVDRTKVKSTGWLVKNDQLVTHINFTGNDHLLLVTTGEASYRNSVVRCFDRIFFDAVFCITVKC